MNIDEIIAKKEEIDNIEEDIKRKEQALQESKNLLEEEQEKCNHDILVKLTSKKYVYTGSQEPYPMTYCTLCHKHIPSYGNKEIAKKTINIVGSVYEKLLKDTDDNLMCSLILNNFLMLKSAHPQLDDETIIENLNKSIANNEEELTRTLHN
jgi:hypothetical protein